MKKIFILLLITTLSSCGGNDISEEKIKSDLIGTTIKGAWNFDMPSEFLDIRIIEEKDTDIIKEIKTEFILKDFEKQSTHYLLASLIYKKENGEWKYIKGNKLSYDKTNRIKFKERVLNSNNPNVIIKEVIWAIFEDDYITIDNYVDSKFKKSIKGITEHVIREGIILKKIEVLENKKEKELTVYTIKMTILNKGIEEHENEYVGMKKIDGKWKFMIWR